MIGVEDGSLGGDGPLDVARDAAVAADPGSAALD